MKQMYDTKKPDIYVATTPFFRDKDQADPPGEPPVPSWLSKFFLDEISGIKSTYALKWPHMGSTDQFICKSFSGQDRNECDHIINTLTIRADGSVVPCCYDLTSKLVMGNILNKPLADIWNNRKYQILRLSINSKKYISICANCAVVRPPIYLVPNWLSVHTPHS